MFAPILLDIPLLSPQFTKQSVITMRLQDRGFTRVAKRLGKSNYVYHYGGGMHGAGIMDWFRKIFGIVKKGIEVAKPMIEDGKKLLPSVIKTVGEVVDAGKKGWEQIKTGNIKDAIGTTSDTIGKVSTEVKNVSNVIQPHVTSVRDLLNHTRDVLSEKEKQSVAQTAVASQKMNELKAGEKELNALTRKEAFNEAIDPKYDAVVPATVQEASGLIRQMLRKKGMKTTKRLAGRGFKMY